MAPGRFTREDPIGLTGGLNLYGFGAGDPVNYADPFGLKVCLKSNPRVTSMSHAQQIRTQREALETATGAEISLDQRNCISEIKRSGPNPLADRLEYIVNREEQIDVRFYQPFLGAGTQHFAFGRNISEDGPWGIVELSPNLDRYPVQRGLLCTRIAGGRSSYAAVLTHELLGHVFHYLFYPDEGASGEPYAIGVENIYHRLAGEPIRCGH